MLGLVAGDDTVTRDHWWWRPGWRPGRSLYTWHFLMDGQPALHEFTGRVHAGLHTVPVLDPIPPQWLHMTTQDVAFTDEIGQQDLAAIAKELADLLYVVYGTAVSYGIDMGPVFTEVHRSNMSKVGGYKREDGKWVKPPTYSAADIAPILAEQQTSRKRMVESVKAYEEVEPLA